MTEILSFVYNNILSVIMLVLLIATGVFLSVRTGFLQFRKFGYVMKNTVGSMFDAKQHEKGRRVSALFRL